MEIYKIIGLALVTAIILVLIKNYNAPLSLPITIGAGAVILLAVLNKFMPLISSIKSLVALSGINNQYLTVIIKALGISYITQFASDICNDFGQTSLSGKIELCGRITLAALSLPLVSAIIKIISEMM